MGIVLLIIPSIAFYFSFTTLPNRADIVGFVLLIFAGILALKYKREETEKEKRRKALLLLIAFLEKINTVSGWNERIHKLRGVLKEYERYLPDDIRWGIENVAYYSDIEKAKAQINDELRKIGRPSVAVSVMKGIAVILFATIGTVFIESTLPSSPVRAINLPDNIDDLPYLISSRISDTSSWWDDNHVPDANAGEAFMSYEGQQVTLNGEGSRDRDGDFLTYSWDHIFDTTSSGLSNIGYSNIDSKLFTFIAPYVDKDTTLTFGLTVNDGKGGSDSDTVEVQVIDMTAPPEEEGLIPPDDGEGPTLIPPDDGEGPTLIPPDDGEGPTLIPPDDGEGPTLIPPDDGEGPTLIPPDDGEGPTLIPPDDGEGPTLIPPDDGEGPTLIPPDDGEGPTLIPPDDGEGPTLIPPDDGEGPTLIPPDDGEGPTLIPPDDGEGPTLIPPDDGEGPHQCEPPKIVYDNKCMFPGPG